MRLQPFIARAMPRGFRHLITRELLDFRVGAEHLHVARDAVSGSAARDWSNFSQRMRYVWALFATRHLDPEVFAPPYGRALTEELREELGLSRNPSAAKWASVPTRPASGVRDEDRPSTR
jgi:hypothetical protein